MARELNLSDDQRAQIKAIMTASRADSAQWRSQLEELRQQVHDAVVANGYDEGQVRTLVQAKSSAMVDMTVHGVATLAKVRAVLTPDQQSKLEQLWASRPRGGPGMGGMGAEFGPPGFGPPAL
jgi:Spy/CpxP family protein refolding chaperone